MEKKSEEMKTYNKSILEYSDVTDAVEYAGELSAKRTQRKNKINILLN